MFPRSYRYFIFALITTFFGLNQAQAQTEFPPAYNNQAHYAVGDLVTDYGNIYRCEVTVSKPYLDPSKTYQNWELFYVRSNTTLAIGEKQTFPTLAIAWNYVRNARVATSAYLHLSIVTSSGDLNESFSAPLNLDMASGAQVSIIGDHQSNVNFSFSNSGGFSIDSGYAFGSISNVNITGSTASAGIYATGNASIANISGVTVTGFNEGVDIEQTARATFGQGVELNHAASSACYVTDGGAATFADGVSISVEGDTGGLSASYGGRIVAEGSNIQGAGNGVSANNASFVDVTNSTFTQCATCCYASTHATVQASYCSFPNLEATQFTADDAAIIIASGDTQLNYSATNSALVLYS